LPLTQYARSGDVNVAYQVVGGGALDLVRIPSMAHHVELAWESPAHARFLNRLGSISRLIVFDKRGTGMSDRLAGGETLEARMDDIRAVMDAAGSERAVLFGFGEGGPLCVLFAATYPDRTSGLVLMNSTPRIVRAPALPWLPSRGDMEKRAEEISRSWGDPAFHEQVHRRGNPSATEEELRGYIRVSRLSVSPGAAATYMRANLDVDVCDVLPLIRVPTLVLQRTEISGDVRNGRYLAEHIGSARLVELPGRDFEPAFGDQERLFSELEAFLANVRDGGGLVSEPDRVLATVLFTDIVDATARAADLGDSAWRELLQKHHEAVRSQLSRFRGREMDTAGDGFFATFDGPARGINCALAIRESVRELGLEIRAGLHTGECELVDSKTGGIAVHIGARVASQAAPNDVLVSSTVKDLVAGSGIGFEDRGPHELKGIPGEWRLYAVVGGT
jgi:class 3 adenylate cyclase/pimeloyl-ACP methyl ester carboxylesterase